MVHLLPAVVAALSCGILLANASNPAPAAPWLASGGCLAAATCLRRGPLRVAILLFAAVALGAASLAGRLADAGIGFHVPEEATVEATVAAVQWTGDRLRTDWRQGSRVDGVAGGAAPFRRASASTIASTHRSRDGCSRRDPESAGGCGFA